MKFPTLSALWLGFALWCLLFSVVVREWFWSIVLAVLVIYGLVGLVSAIRACEKRYRSITLSGCLSAITSLLCLMIAGSSHGTSHFWGTVIYTSLGLLNGGLAIRNHFIIADSKEVYQRITLWEAEHSDPEELELLGQSGGQ